MTLVERYESHEMGIFDINDQQAVLAKTITENRT